MDPDAKIKKSEEEMRRLKAEQDSLQGKIEQTDQAASQLQQEGSSQNNQGTQPLQQEGSAQTGQEAQQSQQSGPPQQDDGKAAQAAELSNAKSSYESLLSQVKVEYLSAEEARKVAGEEKFQADKAAEESQKIEGSAQFQNVDQALNAAGGEKAQSVKPGTEDRGYEEKNLTGAGKFATDWNSDRDQNERLVRDTNKVFDNALHPDGSQTPSHSDGGTPGGPNTEYKTLTVKDGGPQPEGGQGTPATGDVAALFVAGALAAKATQKIYQAGQEALEDRYPQQDAELHDLSKEQDAAKELKNSGEFAKKDMEGKAADLKDFFGEQDKLRQSAWEDVYQKTDTMLAEAHKNDRTPDGYIQDHNQFESDLQAARQAEQQDVQQWRSEFVNGVCKEEATKQVTQENKQTMQKYDQRLEDLGKEAHPALRENAKNMLDAAAPEKIEQKTADLQQQHFPEIPPPSVESPSLGSPSVSAPAVEAPALSTPGSGSGPGGGR